MPRQTDDMMYHADTSSLRGILHAALGATKPNDGLKNLINQCDLFASYQGNPHGFTDSTDGYTNMSFTDGTKTFQISPVGGNFDVWIHGKRYRFTVQQSVAIPVIAEGIWYFYFTGAGVLTASQTPWDLTTDTPVALIYWDNSGLASTAFVDYRQGIYQRWMDKKVDSATGYATRYSEGLGLSNFTTAGTGAADSDCQFDVAGGTIFVNDLEVGITDGTTGTSRWEQTLSPAEAPIYYLDTATPVWNKVAANAYPVYDNTPNEINYNQLSGGTWSAAQATQGYFVAMWLFATSEYTEPVILVLGQREDATLTDAKLNNRLEGLTLPSLPVPDMQPMYRLIFETDTAFANVPKAALRDIQDLRGARFVDGEYIPPPGLSSDDLTGFKQFNGFADSDPKTTSTIGMNGANLEITPFATEYDFWVGGKKFTKTGTDSVAISDDLDLTYVWFDAAGNLQKSTAVWDILDDIALVATVYKDGANYEVTDERHYYDRDRAWHRSAHFTFGARYESGHGGSFTNTTFSIAAGSTFDEDLERETTSPETACNLWYRNGGLTAMRVEEAVATPYKALAGVLQYDNAGSLTPVANNSYVNSYVYATGDVNRPIGIVVGQDDWINLTLARNENLPSILLSTAEWKLLYRVTYQERNTGTPLYIEQADFRAIDTGPAVIGSATSHTALLDRDTAGSHPIEAISTALVAGEIPVSVVGGSFSMKKFYVIEPADNLVTILNGLASNSFVWLADGTHNVASQVNLSNKTNITIAGSKAAVLNVTYTSGTNPPFAITAPSSDISFEGFTIDYNGTATSDATALFGPIGSGDHNRLSWKNLNVRVDNGGSGGSVMLVRPNSAASNIYGLVVEGCTMTGADPRGFVRFDVAAGQEVKNVQILGNTCIRDANGGVTAFSLIPSATAVIEDVLVEGNIFKNLGEIIYISVGSASVSKIVITGNTFEGGAGTDGARFEGSGLSDLVVANNIFDTVGATNSVWAHSGSNLSFSNNTVINSAGDGIRVESGVSDSKFHNNTVTDSAGDGIQTAGSDNKFSDNYVFDNTGYGINETGGTGNAYDGNLLDGNTSGPMNLNGSGHKNTDSFIVAASDEVTALTTGTGKVTFRMPHRFYTTEARISVTTAPTGSTLDVDVNDDGTSIFSTVLTIDATEKTSTTAATPAVISNPDIADDSEMTVDIDQIGSGTAGAGLKVTLLGYKV